MQHAFFDYLLLCEPFATQMLDGQENALEVSSSHVMNSPIKPRNSPSKQQTLDPFLKRCKRSLYDDTEEHPMPKVPKN